LLEPFLRNRPGYYDTIFVSRPHNMKILRTILDAHPEWFDKTNVVYDAEAIFATREITFRQLTGTSVSSEELSGLLQDEVKMASTADCVTAVSASDAEQFRRYHIETVQVIGHAIAPAPTPCSFEEREGFLFVGAVHEEASPNGDSIIWFLEDILPRIQRTLGPQIPVTIAGVNKSQRVKQLVSSAVRITGHLPELMELYNRARVFVAPTRYAAGIPHKAHEAAARGIPIVATPLLASQLGWAHENPFLVAGDAESFAEQCIRLHTDAGLWTRLRAAGLDRIEMECCPETFEKHVLASFSARRRRSLTNVGMDR